MMNEKQNQENIQGTQDNQEVRDGRFDYMNQKPHYSRRTLVLLSAIIAVVVIALGCGVGWVANIIIGPFIKSNTDQAIANVESATFEAKQLAAQSEVVNLDELLSSDTSSEDAQLEYAQPEYTEEPIVLALYQTPVSDHEVVTTSADEAHAGYYVLQPDTIYAIRWDASPLYRNSGQEVEADITVSSDFLIGGGIDGEGVITVRIRDYNRNVDYVGELNVAADNCNLGIEFCSDQCRRYGYGGRPRIEDKTFTICFYTSGQYVESVSDGTYSSEGHYSYTYGTKGSELMNDTVTRTTTPSAENPKDCPPDKYPPVSKNAGDYQMEE